MKGTLGLTVAFLFLTPAFSPAVDPKLDDLLGKWELIDAAAGIPKGAVFDFQKDGKLVIVATIGGAKKTFDFKYKLKGSSLEFIVGDKADTTEIVVFDKKEMVCKDKDGTMAKFKRTK